MTLSHRVQKMIDLLIDFPENESMEIVRKAHPADFQLTKMSDEEFEILVKKIKEIIEQKSVPMSPLF